MVVYYPRTSKKGRRRNIESLSIWAYGLLNVEKYQHGVVIFIANNADMSEIFLWGDYYEIQFFNRLR